MTAPKQKIVKKAPAVKPKAKTKKGAGVDKGKKAIASQKANLEGGKKQTEEIKSKEFYQQLMCAAISTTAKGLKKLCEEFRKEDPNFPSHMSFIRWNMEDENFRSLYARAKEEQADILADEMVEIADDDSLDIGFKEDGTPFVKGDNIQRARLRVEARKWIASKLKPKKYGDKLEQTITGDITYKKIEIELVRP